MATIGVLGVDVGTSSTKGVLVALDGEILRSAVREHDVERPRAGHVEMDATVWWQEFVSIARELTGADEASDGGVRSGAETGADHVEIVAVGVSGMGPCVLVTDKDDVPLRNAILYGVDTRATVQIDQLNAELGADAIITRCGSALTTQAVGPKLRWIAENEPELWQRARRLYMPSSWLARHLTGEYVLDFHSASQAVPLFDRDALDWYAPWAEAIAPDLELPSLRWAGDSAGVLTKEAAELTGIPAGIPVITGTIDAWSEAISIGAHNSGDLMLMYGSTMFFVNTVPEPLSSPSLWGTVGALPGTHNLAGGMATSGALTGWLRDLVGSPDYGTLLEEAAASGPGAKGLLVLPYFAGERTPIMDPDARGIVAGLTLSHGRGDLYRAILEATALGARNNIEAIRAAGGQVDRLVAVGGGTQGNLWLQIVSDVTGIPQSVPAKTIGASYGAAFLAAGLDHDPDIAKWNPIAQVVEPDRRLAGDYDELFDLYRELYASTTNVTHALAQREKTLRT